MLGPTSFWKLFGEICSCCQDVLTVLFMLVYFAPLCYCYACYFLV